LDPEIGHRQSAFRLRLCTSLSPSVQTSIKRKSNIRMDEIVRVNVGDHFGRLSRDARIMGSGLGGYPEQQAGERG
jgi:hypothetical protein